MDYSKFIKNTFFIIDFDSTFVTVEAFDELGKLTLSNNPQKEEILQQIKQLTIQAMEGKIPFWKSLGNRMEFFTPNKEQLEELILFLKEHITPSIARNKSFFKNYAQQIYIISGGFEEYIYPVVKDFGIERIHILANRFMFDKEDNIIGYDKTNLLAQQHGKVEAVKKLNLRGEIIVIGDGYTDFEIKENGIAQKFYAFTENISRKTVTKLADAAVKSFDEILEEIFTKDSP